ncbi:hypothetical protein BX616_009406 [Lobosporangium transversale]|uniref:DUF7719 domain-containing protein n=1 Tax=Lobosporangium transversale TaxID=64571 RepID=A0A1Y2G9Q4_9FUNG|nr:hypothetical protein BCR41DRAFT_389822 [Lobosporangium transversale]KAF9913875.1 hypothetical protein BX616_009406 [Lobosporangium transversale]ORZ04850.1 hypothetical protein BCR41DRAFT_389822 [Lobosporangium transversale]|eukprot:XP_021876787.1 hypothetical protein BCR41DRAFT_389822 [Lobosporangium transversale]
MAGRGATQKNNTAESSSIKASTQSVTKRKVASTTASSITKPTSTPKIQEIGDNSGNSDDDDDDDDDDSDNSETSESDIDDIPEPEKWRLITESGILDQVKASDERRTAAGSDSRSRRQNGVLGHRHGDTEVQPDYIFEGIFFSIPTTCLFIVMDILVHRQYGETYSGPDALRKVIKIFPAILIMVYFSNKHKAHKLTQAAMFIVSIICGCYFLHTMYRSPAMGIMLRAPGVITILVYCIVQLHLLPAVISLALCGLYYQFGNAKYSHPRR